MDEIHLEGIAAEVSIGVYEWEKAHKQRLVIDLILYTDTRQAAATDDLAFTVDYEQVSSLLLAALNARHYQLIETLAETIAEVLLTIEYVASVRLSISKPAAVAVAKNTRLVILRNKITKK